ncbi:hypothetical protein [Massilia consociata]|uniref:DUF3592 domain-containing protein n=1 Tax=Massilia consociata TaxID=760117 RepID=A0ABV6FGB5_9BURK
MDLILTLLFVALAVWHGWRRFKSGIYYGGDRSILVRVDEEFRQLRVSSERRDMCFDGRTAHIVKQNEEGRADGDGANYVVVRVFRYARNPQGEYFYFISEGNGRPYFKHISQQNAKIALGKRYIAPSSTPSFG